jgi:hypothetical protein
VSMGNCRVRLSRAAAVVCAAAIVATATQASAFSLKHTQSGLDVRWNVAHVDFVVDPQLTESVGGSSEAVSGAAQSWSGAAGAPSLSTHTAAVGPKPALDSINSVFFLHDFEPAGGALAMTIVSFEAATGYIVDTDIVINADHTFAVLPPGARASSDSPLVPTEGGSEGGGSRVFDLTHVTAHEIGHALGLADESSNVAALMYPYTKAGDASVRTPGSDDLSGIDQAYAGANLDSGPSKGCGGGASVAGRRAGGAPWWAALLVMVAGGSLVSRRRRWGLVPCAVALAALVGTPSQAQSAGVSPVDATARVMTATTRSVDGIFQTTLDLVPRTCRVQRCPTRAVAFVWGGTIDGITEQVGENPLPSVDDEVDLAWATPVEGDVTTPRAVVLAVRPLAAPLPYR